MCDSRIATLHNILQRNLDALVHCAAAGLSAESPAVEYLLADRSRIRNLINKELAQCAIKA